MSLIVKAMRRYDAQNPSHERGLSQNRLARLRSFRTESAICLAKDIGGIASRCCDTVLRSTYVRKNSASRIAWLLVGMMAIFVFITVSRSISQIEADIAGQMVPDQDLASAGPAWDTTKDTADTSDFQSSSRDLALPLSRHVLKFVPPPANRHRPTAKPPTPKPPTPEPATNEHAQPAAFNNQRATTVPYTAAMAESPPITDNNLIQTTYPILKDPLVRLTAISCFDGRQLCKAIINGQTVRTGQTIFNYTLARIGSGEVLMQRNKKYLLLKMDRGD